MTGNETRLGPDDLVGREFAIGLRGYDRQEVDAFLGQAAEAWRVSMDAAPPINGLSSSAMAALADTQPAEEAPEAEREPVDPFAAPAPEAAFSAPHGSDTVAPPAPPPPPSSMFDAHPADPAPSPEVTPAPTSEATPTPAPEGTRAEAERDRTAAYAERKAAELDRAQARTELARAQEEALQVVDQAQRRAEVVLTGAHDRAQAEAEAVLEDARSRLTPLLEQERTVRARLARLRGELDAMAEGGESTPELSLPAASDLVTATEDDPETPEASFPGGYGSVSVGS